LAVQECKANPPDVAAAYKFSGKQFAAKYWQEGLLVCRDSISLQKFCSTRHFLTYSRLDDKQDAVS